MTYGKAGQVSSMLCVCHSPHDDLCFAGADNGEIYVWQGTTLRRTIKGHKGAVYAMYALRNTAKEVRCCMSPLPVPLPPAPLCRLVICGKNTSISTLLNAGIPVSY